MKIAYLGDFSEHWHTETHCARELELLGHQVQRVPADQPCDNLEADLLLLQGNGANRSAEDWILRARAQGIPSASYHLDLYVGLARQAKIGHEPLWHTDVVFTADGDPTSAAFFRKHAINHRWLPPAVFSQEVHPGTWRDAYEHDVVFVGAEQYHPEWTWRPTLLRFLHKRYGERFKVYSHHPPTRGQDLNDLFATARVVVGDSLALPGHRNYWSDRYFETLGRGGFLVAPSVPGLAAFLNPGVHFANYRIGDVDAVADLIDIALECPDLATKMADEGHAHVVAHHTYAHRMRALTEVI